MKKIFIVILFISLFGILVFSACSASAPSTTAAPYTSKPAPATTAAPATTSSSTQRPGYTSAPATTSVPAPAGGILNPAQNQSSNTIGLAAGGAKDVANFRENILNDYLPLPTDVTYEGIFYDYYFDTGVAETTGKLFSPSYSYAVTRDPLSHRTEYYLAVGLNSGLQESDFQRKKLNLAIVLDISGSMGESYNQYYYDQFGQEPDSDSEEDNRKNKIQSATESVVSILNQLQDTDRLAIVTFNSQAFLNKPMGPVSQVNMRNLKNNVLDIVAGGSTNLSAGMQLATDQFKGLYEIDSYEYENRIMVLTDAQPNTGDYSGSGLLSIAEKNAENRIYTTFIGIGVDFNSQLIEEITKIKGANYYSVHSPWQFKQRIEEEFDYMVTPLVFDLQLKFESAGWKIDKVFGSPEADESTGKLMRVNTLFASKSEGGETRGGLVLLKLRKTSSSNQSIYLTTGYEDRNGRQDGDSQSISLETTQPEYFANSGIRKGILLVRYASLLQSWLLDERQHIQFSRSWEPCIGEDTGILIPDLYASQWERQSLPLTVSSSYQQIFRNFGSYFQDEMESVEDYTLGQELNIIDILSQY